MAAGVTHALSWKSYSKPAPVSSPRRGTTFPRRWSSSLRPRMCCASSQARLANWSLSSTRCWRTHFASATPSSAPCSATTTSVPYRPASVRRPPLPSPSGSAGRSCRKPGTPLDRVLPTKQVVHIRSTRPRSRTPCAFAQFGGRAIHLAVPMLKDDELIGAISSTARRSALHRQADRAGEELRQPGRDRDREHAPAQRAAPPPESLQQQTATAEVLKVISSSPGDSAGVRRHARECDRVCEASSATCGSARGNGFRPWRPWRAAGADQLAKRSLFQGDWKPSRPCGRTRSRPCCRSSDDSLPAGDHIGARCPTWRAPHIDRRADAQGERTDRRDRHLPPGGPTVHRQADRAGQNFAARPSSRSRTRGCSTSCASRCSSRPPPPTCSRSSAARPSICRRCSIRWSNRRRGFARPIGSHPSSGRRRSIRLSRATVSARVRRVHASHPIVAG